MSSTPEESAAPRRARSLTIGTERASIDTAGRMLLSSRQRSCLQQGYVLSESEYGTICIYPLKRWDDRLDELDQFSPQNPAYTEYMTQVIGKAEAEETLDGAHRIQLSANFRKKFGLEKAKEVMVVADGERYLIFSMNDFAVYDRMPGAYEEDRRKRFWDLREKLERSQAELDARRRGPVHAPVAGGI
jgi:DNA-binding transcriptional regulator/RsmH inhibitor MraZ